MSKQKITPNSKIDELTIGGMIYDAGNSNEVNTGDWRSQKPIFIKENCKQCALCIPVCPDMSIPVDENSNRLDFDYDKCKGCGVCKQVCPFGAIEMKEEEK